MKAKKTAGLKKAAPLTEEQKADVIAYRKKGYMPSEISEASCTRTAVIQRVCKEAGLPSRMPRRKQPN